MFSDFCWYAAMIAATPVWLISALRAGIAVDLAATPTMCVTFVGYMPLVHSVYGGGLDWSGSRLYESMDLCTSFPRMRLKQRVCFFWRKVTCPSLLLPPVLPLPITPSRLPACPFFLLPPVFPLALPYYSLPSSRLASFLTPSRLPACLSLLLPPVFVQCECWTHTIDL